MEQMSDLMESISALPLRKNPIARNEGKKNETGRKYEEDKMDMIVTVYVISPHQDPVPFVMTAQRITVRQLKIYVANNTDRFAFDVSVSNHNGCEELTDEVLVRKAVDIFLPLEEISNTYTEKQWISAVNYSACAHDFEGITRAIGKLSETCDSRCERVLAQCLLHFLHLALESDNYDDDRELSPWTTAFTVLLTFTSEKKLDVNLGDPETGNTPLMVVSAACHNSANEVANFIIPSLLKAQANINLANAHGYTALHHAIIEDNEEIVRELLLSRAEVNHDPHLVPSPCLHCAAVKGNEIIVKLLIDHSAYLDAVDGRMGWTALQYAKDGKHAAVEEILMDVGAHVNAKANKKESSAVESPPNTNESLTTSMGKLASEGRIKYEQHVVTANVFEMLDHNVKKAPVKYRFKVDKSFTVRKFRCLLFRGMPDPEMRRLPPDFAIKQPGTGISVRNSALLPPEFDCYVCAQREYTDVLWMSALTDFMRVGNLNALQSTVELMEMQNDNKTHAITLSVRCVAQLLVETTAKVCKGVDAKEGIRMLLDLVHTDAQGKTHLTDPNVKLEKSGATALMLACAAGGPTGELEATQFLVPTLLNARANLHLGDINGWTALHFACYYDRINVVRDLLLARADPNHQAAFHLRSPNGEAEALAPLPLTMVARAGSLDMVKELLRARAETNIADAKGTTPIEWAARRGHTEVTDLLREHELGNEAVVVTDSNEFTPCFRARLNESISYQKCQCEHVQVLQKGEICASPDCIYRESVK